MVKVSIVVKSCSWEEVADEGVGARERLRSKVSKVVKASIVVKVSFKVVILVKRLLAGCGERVAVKSIDAGQSVDLQWSRCR